MGTEKKLNIQKHIRKYFNLLASLLELLLHRNAHMSLENKRQTRFVMSILTRLLQSLFPIVFYMETVKLTQRSLKHIL